MERVFTGKLLLWLLVGVWVAFWHVGFFTLVRVCVRAATHTAHAVSVVTQIKMATTAVCVGGGSHIRSGKRSVHPHTGALWALWPGSLQTPAGLQSHDAPWANGWGPLFYGMIIYLNFPFLFFS